MTVTAVKPVPTQFLAAAAAALGTAVPIGVVQTITRAVFVNTDTVPHQVTAYCVPNAGAAGPANVLVPTVTIQPGQTYVSPELAGLNMIVGDQLWAFADVANKVNFTVSGVQLT